MKKLSIQEVEIQFRKIHGDKYQYDWSTYVNNSKKMLMICPIHGEFRQKPNNHKNDQGCPICRYIKSAESKSLTTNKQLINFRIIHSDKYNYDWLTYKNNTEKMKMICPIHGEFFQSPNTHKRGVGCPVCGNIKRNIAITLNFNDVIDMCEIVHDNKYTYDETSYINTMTKMRIICPIHGEFWQLPISHKTGRGCPICNSSKGELRINKYLTLNIDFISQKEFDECFHKGKLKFDFYIPSLNACVEYDGIQHFEIVDHYHKSQDDFEEQQLRDKIKTDYCLNNNIKLIRIPYTEFDNIEEILKHELSILPVIKTISGLEKSYSVMIFP